MGGSPGIISDLAGSITPVDGGSGHASTGNFQYTPTAPSTSGRYTAQYATPSASPFLESLMQQRSAPSQLSGLAGLSDISGLANMYNSFVPQQQIQGLQQLAPMTPYMYRPNMTMAQQSLNNVAPSVALQQQRDAEEAARRAAEEAANSGGE